MDALLNFYLGGIAAELIFELYYLVTYSFAFPERRAYQRNLNKVGLSWDPVHLGIYRSSEFKHTAIRFWRTRLCAILGSWLSWYAVLYRIHQISKHRRIRSLLTRRQKLAALRLETEENLLPSEVLKLLRVVDPSFKSLGDEVPLSIDMTQTDHPFRMVGEESSLVASNYSLKEEFRAWLIVCGTVAALYSAWWVYANILR